MEKGKPYAWSTHPVPHPHPHPSVLRLILCLFPAVPPPPLSSSGSTGKQHPAPTPLLPPSGSYQQHEPQGGGPQRQRAGCRHMHGAGRGEPPPSAHRPVGSSLAAFPPDLPLAPLSPTSPPPPCWRANKPTPRYQRMNSASFPPPRVLRTPLPSWRPSCCGTPPGTHSPVPRAPFPQGLLRTTPWRPSCCGITRWGSLHSPPSPPSPPSGAS